MRYLKPNEGLKVFDIKFDVTTAGPSNNDNKRIELFLLGCDKAMRNDPCIGCFNSLLWDDSKAEFSRDVAELAMWIIDRTPNKNKRYITIGGAEPTYQINHLIPFCKILKEHGFHIMIYTYRELEYELNINNSLNNKYYNVPNKIDIDKWNELFLYTDIVVDGPFVEDKKVYKEDANDGFLNSIGSSNQKIWDIRHYREFGELRGYQMENIAELKLNHNNDLIYYLKQ